MTHPLAHVHALIGDAFDWRRRAHLAIEQNEILVAQFAVDRTTDCVVEALDALSGVADPALADEVEDLRRVIAELGGQT